MVDGRISGYTWWLEAWSFEVQVHAFPLGSQRLYTFVPEGIWGVLKVLMHIIVYIFAFFRSGRDTGFEGFDVHHSLDYDPSFVQSS